jgi:hypothetical protein
MKGRRVVEADPSSRLGTELILQLQTGFLPHNNRSKGDIIEERDSQE